MLDSQNHHLLVQYFPAIGLEDPWLLVIEIGGHLKTPRNPSTPIYIFYKDLTKIEGYIIGILIDLYEYFQFMRQKNWLDRIDDKLLNKTILIKKVVGIAQLITEL